LTPMTAVRPYKLYFTPVHNCCKLAHLVKQASRWLLFRGGQDTYLTRRNWIFLI
jgi:hypothetical protein